MILLEGLTEEMMRTAEALQKDCNETVKRVVDARADNYNDAANAWMFTKLAQNAWMFTKLAQMEVRLQKLENTVGCTTA